MDVHGYWLLPLLLCSLCAEWMRSSAHTDPGELYPPSSITFGMNGFFCLFWKWTPTNSTTNCSLLYSTTILPSANMPVAGRNEHLYFTRIFDDRIDLNNLTLKVQTECEGRTNRTSKVKLFTSPLATGNSRTMVRNMTCVWHYNEYVNCTWRPGEVVPPNVNYSLHYWLYDLNYVCPSVENKQPTPFHDLLDKGEPCQNYTYQNGIPIGCWFKLVKPLKENNRLVAVVTDRSQDIKPYIYFTCLNSIAKIKAPVINDIKITPNNTLLVKWNGSHASLPVIYEVQLEKSNSDRKDYFKVLLGNSKDFHNARPDITYTAKVRVSLTKDTACFLYPSKQNENFLWSDWSEKKTLEAVENKRITFIVLFFLVSLFISVTTVLLLIYMRRLLLLICPRIPDPSKVISSDFQHWLMYEKSVYNEPKKEEVCVVSLLETSSPS